MLPNPSDGKAPYLGPHEIGECNMNRIPYQALPLTALALSLGLLSPLHAQITDISEQNANAIRKADRLLAPQTVSDLKQIQGQVKGVLKKVMPATVAIIIPDPRGRGIAAGSGVIVSEDGFVLTAGHISQKPGEKCSLIFANGKKIQGETLGWNKARDAGMIKITDEGKWPFVALGDSTKVSPGDWCLTIGHPGGYKPGRTPVVRLGKVLGSSREWIQTDTPLVGGDSGGPLFDLEGKLVGIHSWISQSLSGNMHVPVNTYKQGWDRLASGEEWGNSLRIRNRARPPAYMGIAFNTENDDLQIAEVYPDTPASRIGIKPGDVVKEVGGEAISNRKELMEIMVEKRPGDEIELTVEREKKEMKFILKLGQRDD